MKSKLTILIVLIFVTVSTFGQDETWEPQKQITGYLSAEADYFSDLKYFDRSYGMSLAEAGLLVNYIPLRKLTIKGVFVYRPGLNFDQMLNELNAEWSFNSSLNVKAGRFLTPLSPVNTYFYAPVNLGVSLPVFVSHHEMYPLTIDGLSVNGSFGSDFKINYNAFGGGYFNTLFLPTGPVSFFGSEDNYFAAININNPAGMQVNTTSVNSVLHFGGGGHVGFAFKDMVTVGVNVFTGKENFEILSPTGPLKLAATKSAWGIDAKFKYNNFQISGEKWFGKIKFNDMLPFGSSELDLPGAFVETSYSFGKLTPYLNYEEHEGSGVVYSRYKAGINFKPIFETTFKLEYLHYKQGKNLVDGAVLAIVYSF